MNVMDRSFSVRAAHEAEKLAAARRRRRRIALLVFLALTFAAAAIYVWATMLCGDCGAPVDLPPPA
jgi:hypothetical protein